MCDTAIEQIDNILNEFMNNNICSITPVKHKQLQTVSSNSKRHRRSSSISINNNVLLSTSKSTTPTRTSTRASKSPPSSANKSISNNKLSSNIKPHTAAKTVESPTTSKHKSSNGNTTSISQSIQLTTYKSTHSNKNHSNTKQQKQPQQQHHAAPYTDNLIQSLDEEKLPYHKYTIKQILDRRFNINKQQYEYLISWSGFDSKTGRQYDDSDNSYEPIYYVDSQIHRQEFYKNYHEECSTLLQQSYNCNTKQQLYNAIDCFNQEGVIYINDKLTDKQIQQLQCYVDECYTERSALAESIIGKLNETTIYEFVDYKQRNGNRIDIRLDPAIINNILNSSKPSWLQLIIDILDNEQGKAGIELVNCGCMISLPGSDTQPWHADGIHRDYDTDQPIHALNVFIPLVDITTSIGATQFIPRSFLLDNFDCDKTAIDKQHYIYGPKPQTGQCIIFDFRLKHRGVANRSNITRPLLYLTYAIKPFTDNDNFNQKHYLPPLQPFKHEKGYFDQ